MSENSRALDTTEYGPYLTGVGFSLEEIHERFDPVESALKGYNLFTVHERDLCSFGTLDALQAWVAQACDLSQVKPKVRLLRSEDADHIRAVFSERGHPGEIPTYHCKSLETGGVHMHPVDKPVWRAGIDTKDWFAFGERSEGHGWEEPMLRFDFSKPEGERLRESYMCTLSSFVNSYYTNTRPDAPTAIYPDDVIVFEFEVSGQPLIVPSVDSMLNITISNEGFEAEITCHYAPPRKRHLNALKEHREQWANWHDDDGNIQPAQLEEGAAMLEQLIGGMLAAETGETGETGETAR